MNNSFLAVGSTAQPHGLTESVVSEKYPKSGAAGSRASNGEGWQLFGEYHE